MSKAPPARSEPFDRHVIHSRISRTDFIIGQDLLSWVFSNESIELIGLSGALLSEANNLIIGQLSVPVLVARVPGVLVKFECRLLGGPAATLFAVNFTDLSHPHFPEFNSAIFVRIVGVKESFDLGFDFQVNEAAINI